MQRKRSSDESLPETFEFDNGSSSNSSGLDQQIHWNSMLNQVEPQNLPNYLLPPTGTNMLYMNMASQDGNRPSIWNSGGTSSNEHTVNLGRQDETKLEHEWTSLRINAGGSMTEERCIDAANMLSLENVNINLNSNQVDDEQSFIQNSNVNDILQDPVHDAGIVGIRSAVLNSGLCPHPGSGILTLEHGPSTSGSSNPCASSSMIGLNFMAENGDDRLGNSLDGRRSACKRKTIEGFLGQSSASGANFLQLNESSLLHAVPAIHNASTNINLSSSDLMSGANSSEERLNARFSTIVRGMASECYPPPSITANAESSQRNFRMRVNPAHQHDIYPTNSYAQESTNRHSGLWLTHQPSLFIPLNQSLESRTVIGNLSSQAQPHVPIIPTIPRNVHSFPWNGLPNSMVGNSSNSITSEESLIAPRDETNLGIISRSNLQEQSVFVPSTDIRHLVQDSPIWSLENGTMSIVGNVAPSPRTGTNPVIYPSLGPTWVPHQNSPAHHARSLSEVVRRSLFPSDGSDSGGHSHNSPVQRSGQSPSSQEVIGHQSGPRYRNHHQPYMRSAFLLERQNTGVLGVPLSMRGLAAARDGRSRMISEIRNALDLMRRGENLRFEDVFIFDQAVLYGGANLHDRHRDMRLDVDNMTYEELLALEERIGNVSTGLSEETILKSLKQQKYFPMQVEASMEEPCCICQEEYVEGEDLGTLDCGHDFHTSCIKQWLMHKNMCPVCKTTALVT